MWMTSASELFHNRRYRFGLRHNALDVSGFNSSLADANSSSSHQHRTINRRHNHHYSTQNTRREYRHDLDACDPASRRIHRRRLDHSEHESVVEPEQGLGRSQSPSGSIINSDDFRSIQRRRATGNDRLPGAVLLARERLVERLRGVSVSGNRQSSGGSYQDSRFIGSENNMLEEMRSEERRRKHELKWLELEVFGFRNDDERSNSRECTICLEGFEEGDRVIRLNCTHTFHSRCLFPWVRVCGACPNCRKPILVK